MSLNGAKMSQPHLDYWMAIKVDSVYSSWNTSTTEHLKNKGNGHLPSKLLTAPMFVKYCIFDLNEMFVLIPYFLQVPARRVHV